VVRHPLLCLLRRSYQMLLRRSFTFAHSDPHLTRQTAPTRGPRCRRSQRLFHPDAGALEIELGDQVETVGA
jgi:hypothetical protein